MFERSTGQFHSTVSVKSNGTNQLESSDPDDRPSHDEADRRKRKDCHWQQLGTPNSIDDPFFHLMVSRLYSFVPKTWHIGDVRQNCHADQYSNYRDAD
jgi:hypothetical protein